MGIRDAVILGGRKRVPHKNASPLRTNVGPENQALCEGSMRVQTKPFALCIDNTGYRTSLIPGKVYPILPDPQACRDELVRIVDESGEDCLYHRDHFVFVDFPSAVKRKILALRRAA